MNSHVCQVFGVQVFAKLVREAIAAELSRGKERTNIRYTAYKLRVISRCRGGYRDINSRTNVKFLYHGSPFGNFVVCSSARWKREANNRLCSILSSNEHGDNLFAPFV